MGAVHVTNKEMPSVASTHVDTTFISSWYRRAHVSLKPPDRNSFLVAVIPPSY
jgi:hypothetical protein